MPRSRRFWEKAKAALKRNKTNPDKDMRVSGFTRYRLKKRIARELKPGSDQPKEKRRRKTAAKKPKKRTLREDKGKIIALMKQGNFPEEFIGDHRTVHQLWRIADYYIQGKALEKEASENPESEAADKLRRISSNISGLEAIVFYPIKMRSFEKSAAYKKIVELYE